jgi:putative flippase GtrA
MRSLTIQLLNPIGQNVTKRLIRFVAVGVLCLLIQIFILFIFEHLTHPTIANGIGFIASAQLNFILSYHFTWHDSARKKGKHLTTTWFHFNLVVLFSACINAVVFSLIRYMLIELTITTFTLGVNREIPIIPNVVAAIGATLFSTVCTFLINHHFVLKPERVRHGNETRDSNVPARME